MRLGLHRIFADVAGQVEWESCNLGLSFLNVWYLVDVVTDGFSAFDKIHRSMDLLIAGSKLGFSFSCDGLSSSTLGLLLLVGVNPLSSTRSRYHQSHSPPRQLPSVVQLEQWEYG